MKNKKNKKTLLLATISMVILFIIYTLLVKFYDVATIGPNDSEVGFKTINLLVHNTLDYNEFFYNLTKYLGIIPFFICAFYGYIGLKELIKTKKIAKVDKKIIKLGLFYIVVLLFYVLFEHLVINYRPVILDEGLESSFPSSHTVLALTICLSSLIISKYYIKNKKTLKVFNICTIILMSILVIGRLLSGVHWATDIIGGIILSITLVYTYYLSIFNDVRKKK